MNRFKYLLILSFCIISFSARAENIIAVKVNCMPELNMLSLVLKNYRSDAGWTYMRKHPEIIAEKYHLYDVFGLIDFDKQGKFIAYRPKTISCDLENNHYILKLEPRYWEENATRDAYHYFNPEEFNIPPLYVTLERNGKLLIDKLNWDIGTEMLESIAIDEQGESSSSMDIKTLPRRYIEYYYFNEPDFKAITTEDFYSLPKDSDS